MKTKKLTQKQADKLEALKLLRKWCKPGTKVYTVLRNVSRSGMTRHIDMYCFHKGDKLYLSGYAARVLDYRIAARGGLVVGGCGMDMGYHLVNSLSYALHGMKDKGEAIDSGVRGRPFWKPRPGHYRAGYSLNHEWL